MADKKISELVYLDPAEIASDDQVVILDKSDTTGPDAGPGGATKRTDASAVREFTSHRVKRIFLSLAGIDTDRDFRRYIAEAINAQGPFTLDAPGQEYKFFTVQYASNGPAKLDSIWSYYDVDTSLLQIGGAGPLEITYDQITFNSTFGVSEDQDNSDVFITLGDIGAGPVEDAINLGDTSQSPAVSWDLIQDQNLVTCEISGAEKVYLFIGASGSYGAGGLTAVAGDFYDLQDETGDPGKIGTADLKDVSSERPEHGHVLKYDNSTGQYRPGFILDTVIDTIALSDEDSDLAIGDVFKWVLPFNMRGVIAFEFTVTDAPIGTPLIMACKVNGTDVHSQRPQIDSATRSTITSATRQVLNNPGFTLVSSYELEIEIIQVGSTNAGKGLKMSVVYSQQEYYPLIPFESIIAYYGFEGNANDHTPNGYDAALFGVTPPVYQSGEVGSQGIYIGNVFDESGVNLPATLNDTLKFTNGINDLPFTMFFAVRFEDINGAAPSSNITLFDQVSDQITDTGIRIQIRSQRLYAESFGLNTGATAAVNRGNDVAFAWPDRLGEFIVIAVVDDGSNIDIYDNGSLVTGATGIDPDYTSRRLTDARQAKLYASVVNPYWLFHGLGDTFIVMDQALTADQIQAVTDSLKTKIELL